MIAIEMSWGILFQQKHVCKITLDGTDRKPELRKENYRSIL